MVEEVEVGEHFGASDHNIVCAKILLRVRVQDSRDTFSDFTHLFMIFLRLHDLTCTVCRSSYLCMGYRGVVLEVVPLFQQSATSPWMDYWH